MKAMIEAGAAAVHFEDQLASAKKCGHMGGKVLVPTMEFIQKLTPAQQTYLRTLDMSNAIKQHQRPESTEKIEFLLGGGQR